MKKTFLNGSKAVVEGSIYSGCRYYYGATRPFNKDILNYSSYRFSEVNGIFTQTENERAAIGMVIGSSISGARVLTSSTTEGIFALDEGFSYLCGMEISCVITNIMSGKLGLRNYEPTQSGYGQAVRGGTSGDYKFIVLAPSTVQETYDLTIKAFDLSDKYRNPVMLLLDSALSQNYQNIDINENLLSPDYFENKNWKLDGAENREHRTYKVYHDNDYKYKKFSDKFKMIENEVIFEEFMTEDAEHLYIAFGLSELVKRILLNKGKGIKIRFI
ncbi:MAG: 3-methyl-2-oxobutanoate dehydrogenase subunit beta [Candidatus Sericytochromatia bacterium]